MTFPICSCGVLIYSSIYFTRFFFFLQGKESDGIQPSGTFAINYSGSRPMSLWTHRKLVEVANTRISNLRKEKKTCFRIMYYMFILYTIYYIIRHNLLLSKFISYEMWLFSRGFKHPNDLNLKFMRHFLEMLCCAVALFHIYAKR